MTYTLVYLKFGRNRGIDPKSSVEPVGNNIFNYAKTLDNSGEHTRKLAVIPFGNRA
jgi:hypothetical protein